MVFRIFSQDFSFASYLLTVSRLTSTVSVSSDTGLQPVFIHCAALFLSVVTVYCLLHGFLNAHCFVTVTRGAILLE